MLVSPDFKTTALQVNLKEDKVFQDYLARRNLLKTKEKSGEISAGEEEELEEVVQRFKAHRDEMRIKQHENIVRIRAIMDEYRNDADLFLGGVSMVADDLITYVKNDLKLFGLGVVPGIK